MTMLTSPAMASAPPLQNIFGWRRVGIVLFASLVLSALWYPIWIATWGIPMLRLFLVGMTQLAVFGLFEHWPSRLPSWLARWILQLTSVAIVAPFVAALWYAVITFGDPLPWFEVEGRLLNFELVTGMGVLISPWIAMSALYRQISGQAQRQALGFELERSEFARDAIDSRLRLLQAQVEPHFLFNTLANVRELVDSRSTQASSVLNSLIAYLRAAVPRLNVASTTMAQELELVRAYLELMHMRMPDRLRFTLVVDDAALQVKCPPMTLLTLVENAVRHGIDPSEIGGRIEVRVTLENGRCLARVIDTGVAVDVAPGIPETGKGLAILLERLQLIFSGDAQLSVAAVMPHGFAAELNFPAQESEK